MLKEWMNTFENQNAKRKQIRKKKEIFEKKPKIIEEQLWKV